MDIKREEHNKIKVICIGKNKFYEEFIIDYCFTNLSYNCQPYYCLELKYMNGKTYAFKLAPISLGESSSDSEIELDKEEYNCLNDKSITIGVGAKGHSIDGNEFIEKENVVQDTVENIKKDSLEELFEKYGVNTK